MTERNSYGELRNNLEGFYYEDTKRMLCIQIKLSTDSRYQIIAEVMVLNIFNKTENNPEEFILN